MLDSQSTDLIEENLKQLRVWLREAGWGAVLFSSSSRFLHHALVPEERFLEKILGFQGSFGFFILSAEKAFFLTDHRYVSEEKARLQKTSIVVHAYKEGAIGQCVQECMPVTWRVGADLWCLSVSVFQALQKTCPVFAFEDFGVHRKSLQKILPTQKSVDTTVAKTHRIMPFYRVTELKHSLQDVHRSVADHLVENQAFLATSSAALSWMLNVRWNGLPYVPMMQGYGLFTQKSMFLWCDKNLMTPEIGRVLAPLVTILDLKHIATSMAEIAKKFVVRYVPTQTPYGLFHSLEKRGQTLEVSRSLLAPIQARGSHDETIYAQQAHVKEAKALITLFYDVKKGTSQGQRLNEWDIAQRLEVLRCKDYGYQGPSFPTIASFGSNSALIHYQPQKDRAITLGDEGVLLIDAGGQYRPAATTDATRVLYIGTMPSDTLRNCYTRILKGLIAFTCSCFPDGTRGVHLDARARQFLWQAGMDYPHATGHGVGAFLDVHSPPIISHRDDQMPLKPGMKITCEPGFYKEKQFGMRLEDMMVVSQQKKEAFYSFQTLTLLPFEPLLIEASLLSQDECAWVDAYHHRVREHVLPLLPNGGVQEWLCEQTKPLQERTVRVTTRSKL